MLNLKVIGICGGSWGDGGVGKTTAVNIMSKQMGFYPASFMDPVKDVAKKHFGWDGKMTPDSRVLLDQICRRGRMISENYWRDLSILRIPKEAEKIVFDDLWFDNEAQFVVGCGGFVVRITKQGHLSPELRLEATDVPNDKTLRDFQRELMMAVSLKTV